MRHVFLFVLILDLSITLEARAQNPPFQNPALDSDCYFPQIGVSGEIDTIYGSHSGEGLGAYIHNLGPKADGSLGNMLIGNGSGSYVFEQAPTGPNFDLHSLHAIAQSLNAEPQYMRFGHFHDQSHLDIFDEHTWVIYWADDNGNYDASRYTSLNRNVGISLPGDFTPPYVAYLTSDTVDDIVGAFETKDSLYLALFTGGEKLFEQKVAYEDTSLVMPPPYLNDYHYTLQGDFRGTGRDDLLIADNNNDLFYFRNDAPFTLTNLLDAMLYDTIWSKSSLGIGGASAMHALPKKKGDHSCDVVAQAPGGIYFFRGGPDFGSHRITIDSAAYVITVPKTLGYSGWPDGFANVGDLTGTGNNVLYTGGDYGGGTGNYGDQNFYLTGQALDSKIDMFYKNCPAGAGDTLTANSDSLEDLLLGNEAYDDPEDEMNGNIYHGTIWAEYGSKNIPVHLNPEFADVKDIPTRDGAGLSFYPNPVTQGWSVATIVWPEAEIADYDVYNLLGEVVQSGTIRMLGGADERSSVEQQRMYFPHLASGVYEVLIHGSSHNARAKLVLVR